MQWGQANRCPKYQFSKFPDVYQHFPHENKNSLTEYLQNDRYSSSLQPPLTAVLSIDPFLFHCWHQWPEMFLLAFNGTKWCYTCTCNSTLPCLSLKMFSLTQNKIPQLLPNLKESLFPLPTPPPLSPPLTISWSVATMWTRHEPEMHGSQLLCYLEILNAYSNPFDSHLKVWITSITMVDKTHKEHYHFWSFQQLIFVFTRDEIITKTSLGIKQLGW